MAAALGGEPSSLDTVVYTCCDMLNACELASDAERAAQWCQVADEFRRDLRLPLPLRRVPHLLRQRADGDRTVAGRRAGARRRPAHHRRRVPWPASQGADPPGRPPRPPRAPGGGGPAARRRSVRQRRGRERTPPCRSPRCCSRAATAPAPAACSSSAGAAWNITAPTSPLRSTCSSTPSWPPATSTQRRRPPRPPG